MIHSNHEVKPHRARLVLPWGTRWEARVTNVTFLPIDNSVHYNDRYFLDLLLAVARPGRRFVHLQLRIVGYSQGRLQEIG